ncbi:hypothetical protein ACHAWF_007776 [Thalassiosira exigua]
MPLSGEYAWSEADDHIVVQIPLKGVSPKKVDVFTASTILKVSYAPFLLDLNLLGEIDEDRSRAVLKNGTLRICLFKRDIRSWGQLCFEGSKELVKQRRQRSLKERDDRVRKQMEKVASKKVEEERMVLRKHMELEEKERRRLDQVKATEKRQAEDAMHDAFSRIQKDEVPDRQPVKKVQIKEPTTVDTRIIGANDEPPQDCKEEQQENEPGMPPPRKPVRATFRHTPRLFKTPSRESTVKQEQEFIAKNRSNLKKNALLNGVDVGDADPAWLNAKGDEFYGKGDFRSAINAYTEALEADGTMVRTLGNRAACYLDLREGPYCIEDCLEALKLMDSAGSQVGAGLERAQFRKTTHVRLALAHCLGEDYSNAMKHFATATELDGRDEAVAKCVPRLETLMEASKWKAEADGLFSEGDLLEAKESYARALSSDPSHVKALMNRSACHLAMERSLDCIDDCTRAVELLSKPKERGASLVDAVLSPKPGVQRQWIVTLLCRRAAAKRLDGDFRGALEDLEGARKSVRFDDDIDVESIEKTIISLNEEMER